MYLQINFSENKYLFSPGAKSQNLTLMCRLWFSVHLVIQYIRGWSTCQYVCVHAYSMQIATLQVLIRVYNETSNTFKGMPNSILNGINIDVGTGLLLSESRSSAYSPMTQYHITFYVSDVYPSISLVNFSHLEIFPSEGNGQK